MFAFIRTIQLMRDQSSFNNHEYMYIGVSMLLSLTDNHRPAIFHHTSSLLHTSLLVFVIYLMCCNGMYGIAGSIAYIGMIPIWCSLALMLGREKAIVGPENGDEILLVNRWNYRVFYIFFGFVYFYAGIAKTSLDWLSGTLPYDLLLRNAWNNSRTCERFVEYFSALLQVTKYDFVVLFAYSGLVFDLSAGLGLCFPISYVRISFTVLAVLFHLTNHHLFIIETFPWVMISSCVLYHDSSWMDWFASNVFHVVNKVTSISAVIYIQAFLPRLIYVCWAILASLLLIILLSSHSIFPLLCGIHTLLDPGNVSWGSECHYFNWRMMSRSANTVQCQFRLFNTPLNDTALSQTYLRGGAESALYAFYLAGNSSLTHTLITLESVGYDTRRCIVEGAGCAAGRDFILQTPQYEDRLWVVLRDIRKRAAVESTDSRGDLEVPVNIAATLTILTDVWLEVNGPPIQRFVDPHFDISAVDEFAFQSNLSPWILENYQQVWPVVLAAAAQRERPAWQKSVPWLFPRIEMFRSLEWQRRFHELERTERDVFAAELNRTCTDSTLVATGNCESEHSQLSNFRVLYIADVASSGPSSLVLSAPTRIRVLHGAALFHHELLGVILPGHEIRIAGTILWSPLQPVHEICEEEGSCQQDVIVKEEPCLLMIILEQGTTTFSIV